MQHTRYKKEKRGNFYMYLRLFLCVCIVLGAIMLKATDAPILSKISEKVSRGTEDWATRGI